MSKLNEDKQVLLKMLADGERTLDSIGFDVVASMTLNQLEENLLGG